MGTMTGQQLRIAGAAVRLLAALNDGVPNTTVHYAVEDARRAATTLVRLADGVVTNDYRRE